MGEIRTRSYTNQQGEKRYVTEIQADDVQFLPRGQGGPRPERSDVPAPTEAPRNVFAEDLSDFSPLDDEELPLLIEMDIGALQ